MGLNRYETAFAKIAKEVRVVDPMTFEHAESGTFRSSDEATSGSTNPVLDHLWRFLYLTYYANDPAAVELMEGTRLVVGLPDWEDCAFVERLRVANTGRSYPSGGWMVVHLDQDTAVVHKGSLHLSVHLSELEKAEHAAVGSTVVVRMPCYRRFAQPRWFIVMSEVGPISYVDGPIVRLYFVPDSGQAAELLLAEVTAALNPLSVPFQAKLLNNPEAYVRHDPFVLYLQRRSWLRYRELLQTLHERLAPLMRDDGPCFARELGRGWYTADEPRSGSYAMSFGQHRCFLVAEALLRASTSGPNDAAARYQAIKIRYQNKGLDIARPYVNDAMHMPQEVTA